MNQICKNILTSTIALITFFTMFIGYIASDAKFNVNAKKGMIVGSVIVVLIFFTLVGVCRLSGSKMKPADIDKATRVPSWRNLSISNKIALYFLLAIILLYYISAIYFGSIE